MIQNNLISEDLRQISISILLMSHDLSQPIRIGSETDKQTDRRVYTEVPHSIEKL